MSGNTFGVRVWSDGFRFMPMLQLPPEVGKCGHCLTYFYVEEAKELGYLSGDWGPRANAGPEDPPEWGAAPQITHLEADELFEAVEKGLPKVWQQEVGLRQMAWWQHNHPLRGFAMEAIDTEGRPPSFSPNLEALYSLLRANHGEPPQGVLLLCAEISRELGRYSQAA